MARTVRALGVPRDEVEDVTQAALIAAWRALGTFDLDRPFAAWACVIAANKARDWRRQFRRRRPWLTAQPLDCVEALAAADPSGSPNNEDRDRLRDVARALALLPDQIRTPFVLATTGEFTQPEIAAALGISRKSVETRVARARKHLLKLLASAGSSAVQAPALSRKSEETE